jgi:hypothetical protein
LLEEVIDQAWTMIVEFDSHHRLRAHPDAMKYLFSASMLGEPSPHFDQLLGKVCDFDPYLCAAKAGTCFDWQIASPAPFGASHRDGFNWESLSACDFDDWYTLFHRSNSGCRSRWDRPALTRHSTAFRGPERVAARERESAGVRRCHSAQHKLSTTNRVPVQQPLLC